MIVRVENGTNAGIRKPLAARPEPWACACEKRPSPNGWSRVLKLNPGYLVACPDCGERRPS